MQATVGMRPFRVAIVEDDPVMRDSLAVLFGVNGFLVSDYESAEAFLDDPDGFDGLDCLVLDQYMSGMTGVELLRLLDRRGTRVAAILLSARLTEQIVSDAKQAGARLVLSKPAHPFDLVDHVRTIATRQS